MTNRYHGSVEERKAKNPFYLLKGIGHEVYCRGDAYQVWLDHLFMNEGVLSDDYSVSQLVSLRAIERTND